MPAVHWGAVQVETPRAPTGVSIIAGMVQRLSGAPLCPTWIVAEFARVRTEWIILRAVRELTGRAEAGRRLERSRARVNAAINELSRILTLAVLLSAGKGASPNASCAHSAARGSDRGDAHPHHGC